MYQTPRCQICGHITPSSRCPNCHSPIVAATKRAAGEKQIEINGIRSMAVKENAQSDLIL